MTDNKPYPAPPVALRHIYKFTAPLSGEPIWRPAANMWNGQAAQESVGLYTLAQMNAHADATCAMRAAQPDTLTYPNPIDIFAAMTAQARGRTSPENVVDVLFALHAAGMRNGAAQAARGISKSQKRTAQRMHHMNTNTNAASVPGPEDQKFNAWYESKFKPAMERGPLDKYVARQAWFAAISTAAQPPAGICVPTELAERVQETMGEFLMDHGWRQQDMDTSDEFGALLAAAPKTEPVPGIVERLEAALKRIDDGHAIRRIPADPTDPDLVLAECKAFFEGRPAPFWVKAEPVQSERVPLTLRQREALAICTESRKVSVSEVQRKLKCSYAQAQELCQSLVDYGGLVDGFVISPAIQPAHKEQS